MGSANIFQRAIELALSDECEGIADIKHALIWEGYVTGPGRLFEEGTRELLRRICADTQGKPQQWGRRRSGRATRWER